MRKFTASQFIFSAICLTLLWVGFASAGSDHSMKMKMGDSGQGEHAMHRQMMQTPAKTKGSVKQYTVPALTLINQDRMPIKLSEILNDDRPVMLQFIYASCTTICPVLSAGFSSLQDKLGPEAVNIQLVSITIDPEHDNPEVMKKYRENYQATDRWEFLTGSRKDIDAVLHAFDSYVSNKMSHKPLTFIKIPGKSEWRRLNGLMGSEELYTELRQIHPI